MHASGLPAETGANRRSDTFFTPIAETFTAFLHLAVTAGPLGSHERAQTAATRPACRPQTRTLAVRSEKGYAQAWTVFWAGSRPCAISSSVASAACSQSTGTSVRSAAVKFSSTNDAGSLRPGGRPMPMRTR